MSMIGARQLHEPCGQTRTAKPLPTAQARSIRTILAPGTVASGEGALYKCCVMFHSSHGSRYAVPVKMDVGAEL